MKNFLTVLALTCLLGSAGSASATTLFSEDFEGTLAQWNPNHNGQIVLDPLGSGGHVLNFSTVYAGGDIFSSTSISLVVGQTYTIGFDFYGVKGSDTSSGGFAGLTQGSDTTKGAWYAGSYLYPSLLPGGFVLDDAATGWVHYAYTFVAPITIPNGSGTPQTSIRLMFEDFSGAGSHPANAYFDNITVTTTPLPAALPLFASGLGALGVFGWRRKRKKAAAAA